MRRPSNAGLAARITSQRLLLGESPSTAQLRGKIRPGGPLRKARHCRSLCVRRAVLLDAFHEVPELQRERARGGEILLGMRSATATRLLCMWSR
jgi:hypothetical protein